MPRYLTLSSTHLFRNASISCFQVVNDKAILFRSSINPINTFNTVDTDNSVDTLNTDKTVNAVNKPHSLNSIDTVNISEPNASLGQLSSIFGGEIYALRKCTDALASLELIDLG